MGNIQITVDEYQADCIARACELYARLAMNQFSLLEDVCKSPNHDMDDGYFEQAKWCLIQAFGIDLVAKYDRYDVHRSLDSPDVHNDARVVWDVSRYIEYHLKWCNNPLGKEILSYDHPTRHDTDNHPIPNISGLKSPYILSFFRRMQPSITRVAQYMGFTDDEKKRWIDVCEEHAGEELWHTTTHQTPLSSTVYDRWFHTITSPTGEIIWNSEPVTKEYFIKKDKS